MIENELQSLIDQFLKILNLYAVIGRKPKDYGTGDLLYITEIHTISMVGKNKAVNMTQLADIMGVTRGAISQTIKKLVSKNFILKSNSRNRKEINLRLSEKGEIVYNGLQSFHQEIFAFAATLYEKAKPEDVVLVRNLFGAIGENMQQRVRQL
jgi:DNA-binding MarR family transcriptional regulator